jgi:hypothetical protein
MSSLEVSLEWFVPKFDVRKATTKTPNKILRENLDAIE